MSKKSYRNKPCGYCGQNTGKDGEGEHVLPKAMYPKITDGTIQRLKIPVCPACNDLWEKDEGHFRTVINMLGPKLTPERNEIWTNSCRSFQREDGGRTDLAAVAKMLVPLAEEERTDESEHKIYPLQDARIVRVLRKIVRGLVHYRTGDIVTDERCVKFLDCNVDLMPDQPTGVVYDVPRIFTACALVDDLGEGAGNIHSIWTLRFYENTLIAGYVEK